MLMVEQCSAAAAATWWDWFILLGTPMAFWQAVQAWHAGERLVLWHGGIIGILGLVLCRWLPWPERVRDGLSVLLLVAWVVVVVLRLWLWWTAVPPMLIPCWPACDDCVPV
jgi:hypothetical protein